jgi:hypothetical protein
MAGFDSDMSGSYFPVNALTEGTQEIKSQTCMYILNRGQNAGRYCGKEVCHSKELARDIPACSYHRMVYEIENFRHNHPEELVDEE